MRSRRPRGDETTDETVRPRRTRALTARLSLVGTNAWLALTVELLGCGMSASVVVFALAERLLWPSIDVSVGPSVG